MTLHAATITQPDRNLRGWESVAAKWADAKWPRRPAWKNEFEKAGPLLSKAAGEEALVLGATPEFRAWLHLSGARVSLCEKSAVSYNAMTTIMESQLRVRPPKSEIVIASDWESPVYEKGRYRVIMGDIITGYLETRERFMEFLRKAHGMLADGGVFLLREFANEPCPFPASAIKNVDWRRWAYILTPGVAVEGGVFYEEKLAHSMARIGDLPVFGTCANPPRTRLMLTFSEFTGMFPEAGFVAQVLAAPEDSSGPRPALFALWKG